MIHGFYDDGLGAFNQHNQTSEAQTLTTVSPEASLRANSAMVDTSNQDAVEHDTSGIFSVNDAVEQSKINRGHKHIVIIRNTESVRVVTYEQQLIETLREKNPKLRIFSIGEWTRNNPSGNKHEAMFNNVRQGPECIVVLMNREWQFSNLDQEYMGRIFHHVLSEGKGNTFVPVIIDNTGVCDVDFDKNYDETSDGNRWISKFYDTVYQTSNASWIEDIVKVTQAKVKGTSAQAIMPQVQPPLPVIIDVLCIVHDSNINRKHHQALVELKDRVEEKQMDSVSSNKRRHVRILEGFPDIEDDMQESHVRMVVFIGQGADEVNLTESKDLDDDDYDEADFSTKMNILLERLKPDIALIYLQFGIDYLCSEIVQSELSKANVRSTIVGLTVSRNEQSIDIFLEHSVFPMVQGILKRGV